MNFSEIFIRRPIATVLLTVGFVLLGLVAYHRLPIASLPNLERPMIMVRGWLPGASSETIGSSLTAPLEKQLGLISGLREMASTSIYQHSNIKMEFNLNKNIDVAGGEVLAAINAAGPSMPKALQGPPIYVKANPNGFPIIAIALTSEVYSVPEIYQYADTVLAQKLSQIEGVAKVFLSGSGRPAVRVQVNPRALANMGVSASAVRHALEMSSLIIPKGQLTDGPRALAVETNDQMFEPADYRNLIVGWKNGGPIKMDDVADVFESTVNDERGGWFDDKPAVVVSVMKNSEANVVDTVDQILAMMPQIERWIPPAIHAHVLYDRTQMIRASIADVQFAIAISIALVILVVALFLRRLWLTVIPAVTIPVCLACTLGIMYLLKFNLDNISLMGVTIAVGFIVDDAIIIVENITRLTQAGETPLNAALKGTRQMGFTIMSITIALIAALIPALFMPDIVGRLFREFGLTLVAAIVASAIISLTLTPMLCSRLLRARSRRAEWRIGQLLERCIEKSIAGYVRSLDWSLRHRWLAPVVSAVLVAGSVALYMQMPRGFLPTQDTGVLRVRTVSNTNIAFEAKEASQQEIGRIILADPAVEHLASYIGKGTISGGTIFVSLKPPAVRKASVDQVIARLRKRLAKVRDSRAIFVPMQDLNVGARRTASRYQYALSGLDREEVARWARIMYRRIASLPQATDVVSNGQKAGLGDNLITNRLRAASTGISVAEVDSILFDWFGQRPLQLLRYSTNFHRIVLEVEPGARRDPADLSNVFLAAGVPVDTLSVRKRVRTPTGNPHENALPSVTISFNTPLGVSIDEAQAAVQAVEKDVHIPNQIRREWKGEARSVQEAKASQPFLFLAAIVAVYLILGMLYESYVHPFTILSTLPSATFGALLALALSRTDFTIITALACILVVGIVMKNAIMMVDFSLEAERRQGLSALEAIRQAARLRVRPIVMTTLAALFGALPLALGTGLGAELRQPLGIAAVGGLFVAQFVTLYTTPAVYLAIDALRLRRKTARVPTLSATPTAAAT
jgi:hydrophobe/amphiphile efflux-1 (HAE1) family protein